MRLLLPVSAIYRAVTLTLALLFVAARACAAPTQFGPFTVDPEIPTAIILNGEIGINSALDFRRAVSANPNARVVVLNSPGGLTQIALLIADEVHQRRMSTIIPSGAGCYSSCAFIFFAGKGRQAEGELGVHQMWMEQPDLKAAQVDIADTLDLLNRFGTPAQVLTIMYRTPPEQMYVFSQNEIAELGINRSAEASVAAPRRSTTEDPADIRAPGTASLYESRIPQMDRGASNLAR